MRNKFATLVGLISGVGLLAMSGVAFAADPLSLKLEPGLAVPLTSPQAHRFDAGGDLKIQPLFGLTPWLDVGPSVSVLALTSNVQGVDPGTAWGFGGGLRLKRPHDSSNTGTGFKAASPWVDADLQYIRTGDLDRVSASVGVGVSVPVTNARTVWMGPFARYIDIEDPSRQGYDTADARVLVLGLSVELSPRVHAVAKRDETELTDRDHDGTLDIYDHCPDVPGPKDNHGCPYPPQDVEKRPAPPPPPAAVAEKFELHEIVYFAWDSPVLRPSENPQLEAVTKKLLEHLDYNVRIEGNASSEGKLAHNQKLSEKRADAVLDYLAAHGVDRKRMVATGNGVSKPAADNKTEAGRVLNRRAEFVVTLVVSPK